MRKLDRDGIIVFCALLCIWICAIIPTGESVPAVSRGSDTYSLHNYCLVLDPGHGGADGGAVSLSGTCESAINWDIAVRMFDLNRFLGQSCSLTREVEMIDYPDGLATLSSMKKWDTRQRVSFTNATPDAVLVSIHQNYYPNHVPSGLQILYNDDITAKELSVCLQEWTRIQLMPDNRRVSAPASEDIYIMNHVNCPAILVECGFLSHPVESGLLDTDSYRLKMAAVLTAGIYCFRGEIVQ